MKKKTNRRLFLKETAKACLATALTTQTIPLLARNPSLPVLTSEFGQEIGWKRDPLPYSFDALEPIIDAKTMELHYSRHAAAYEKALGDAINAEKVDPTKTTLEKLLPRISTYSTKMRNNAGGHYNHELFWKSLRAPITGNRPTGRILELIKEKYTSFESFQSAFAEAGKNRFGSGWVWLVRTAELSLDIVTTPNQDNPLMDVSDAKGYPILGLDLWEHAYYLNYQNRRVDYINNWWAIINWDTVEKRLSLS